MVAIVVIIVPHSLLTKGKTKPGLLFDFASVCGAFKFANPRDRRGELNATEPLKNIAAFSVRVTGEGGSLYGFRVYGLEPFA